MSVPTTTMRLDEGIKREAKPILEELGLNISSATNIFLRAVVRCGGLPFDLRLASRPTVPTADFIADYLVPIMSPRNKVFRVGYSAASFRNRLLRRKAAINQGRRIIA